MLSHTKEVILTHLAKLSQQFDFTMVSSFTAKAISDKLHISRSLASQYLNELDKEGKVIKVNSRPVYFFHRQKMEQRYQISFQEDYYDLDELKQYIASQSQGDDQYEQMIGWNQSLLPIVKQAKEAFGYPPCGLPMLILGEKGTGKRTLAQLVYEHAARQGLIDEQTKCLKYEFTANNGDMIKRKLFGTSEVQGVIDKYDSLVLMFGGVQHMSVDFQEKIAHLIELVKSNSKNHSAYAQKSFRFILMCDDGSLCTLQEPLLKQLPVMIHMPSLQERSKEEIEELIIYLLKKEGEVMHKEVSISNVVLRALVNGTYDGNISGLKSTLQVICASALRQASHQAQMTIHTNDLPEYLLATLPIVTDNQLVYIDPNKYQKSEQINFVLDYFTRILKPLQQDSNIEVALKESKHNFDLLSDYVSFKQRVMPEHIQGLEISLTKILDIPLKKRLMNLPSGFCSTLAKLMYVCQTYQASIERYEREQQPRMEEILERLKKHLIFEVMIASEMQRLIQANLEWPHYSILEIISIVCLYHYNRSLSKRHVYGLIVCHGYATATSIAEAVNTMIGSYVFEAVDMPLDSTIDEIYQTIIERLNRMNRQTDVVVMVDMGSLEQLGSRLSHVINCNVGVINNVSTKTALNAGYAILKDESVEAICEKVTSQAEVSYTMVSRKKNDVILFTSESGLHMAKRMRELFDNSFPTGIPVDLEVCDFNELVASGSRHEHITNHNVLFITGTANPHIPGLTFIALEEMIAGNNVDEMTKRLASFLNPDALEQFLVELRKNFTLQNVVSYLTILNPKILLDHVSLAVEKLQDCLNQRFSGKTLIGIYIHSCCLIERLVTKSAITEVVDLPLFEKEHHSFIVKVHEAFDDLMQRYNINIPTSEIAYLYDFIVADSNNTNLISRMK